MRGCDRALSRGTAVSAEVNLSGGSRTGEIVYNAALLAITAGLLIAAVRFVLAEVGLQEVGHAAVLG